MTNWWLTFKYIHTFKYIAYTHRSTFHSSVHGLCHQIELPLNILHKTPGMCIVALANGQTVIAEDWEIVTDIIPVGCECNVKKDSFFARYA